MNKKIIIYIGIFTFFLWILLGFFSIISWQVVGVLATGSIGVTTLLFSYERERTVASVKQIKSDEKLEENENRQITTPKADVTEKKFITGSQLLSDTTEIIKLRIDDDFLDKIYEEARSKAVDTFNDVKLSYFSIQVFPFDRYPHFYIYFWFYSKWADKICVFQWAEFPTPHLWYHKPNKRASSDYDRKVFNNLPWKFSPLFLQALNKSYDRIKPLTSVEGTNYIISASAWLMGSWRITFEDGFNGNEYSFTWDGEGLDENSIKLK